MSIIRYETERRVELEWEIGGEPHVSTKKNKQARFVTKTDEEVYFDRLRGERNQLFFDLKVEREMEVTGWSRDRVIRALEIRQAWFNTWQAKNKT